ncbi:hypothetical protein BpHYR1_033778 [Brachionus plicatilis]|uniref:Uncharacterized protein n=1 Tax=Brachionus plicatilis TaxID=10195 RepID=A0A3M7S1X3_BRAPC|nr:hypothetical protein BpHYR1_033778 [Brachionus plicatilis]
MLNPIVCLKVKNSFFIPILVSKTNHSRLQVLQNISIKYSYNFPHDTPSDLPINFLDDIKLDNIEVRLNKLFIKYLKNNVIFKNSLTIEKNTIIISI